MNRTALALTLVWALLFSAVAGVISVNLVTANIAPLFPLPWEPVTTPPTIIVYSPVQNETYYFSQLLLNFSIVVNSEIRFENVTSVYYIVDGGERQNITVYDIDTLFYPNPRTLNFSTSLTLTEGLHNIRVGVEADSYYVLYDAGRYTQPSVIVNGESEAINFAVQPFPATLLIAVVIVLVIIIGTGLPVFFKKRSGGRDS